MDERPFPQSRPSFFSLREGAISFFAIIQKTMLVTGGNVLWTLPTFDFLVIITLALIFNSEAEKTTENITSQISRVIRLIQTVFKVNDEPFCKSASAQANQLALSFFDVLPISGLGKLHSTVREAARRITDSTADASRLGIQTITRSLNGNNAPQKSSGRDGEPAQVTPYTWASVETEYEQDKFVPDSYALSNFDEAIESMPYVDIDPNLDRPHMQSFPQALLIILKSRMQGGKCSSFALEQFCCAALMERQRSALIANLKDADGALQVHGYKEQDKLALRLWLEEALLSQFWLGARSLVESLIQDEDLRPKFDEAVERGTLDDDTLLMFSEQVCFVLAFSRSHF